MGTVRALYGHRTGTVCVGHPFLQHGGEFIAGRQESNEKPGHPLICPPPQPVYLSIYVAALTLELTLANLASYS